ncbi:unnamed protein product, partial [Staurois parvus]
INKIQNNTTPTVRHREYKAAGQTSNFLFWYSEKVEVIYKHQGQTHHLETRALPKGLGSVGGPLRCPWYLSKAFLGVV